MNSFTVNAYYNPSGNNTALPAGILQPPFFGADRGIAANMGGIGMVIGHELTHGFDDQGAQFDAEGNLKNWWQRRRQEVVRREGHVRRRSVLVVRGAAEAASSTAGSRSARTSRTSAA